MPPKEEIFEVVDADDNVIGTAKRSECHRNPKLLHRTSGVLVFNSRGDVLMTKRSMLMDTNPGKWTISAWGHNSIGESYEAAAVRELKEELGVTENVAVTFLLKTFLRAPYESEITHIFKAVHEGPFRLDEREVAESRFYGIGELKKEMRTSPSKFTSGCIRVMEEYFRIAGVA
jgi:isopentenyl-diphosphate delta-isomerase type 1